MADGSLLYVGWGKVYHLPVRYLAGRLKLEDVSRNYKRAQSIRAHLLVMDALALLSENEDDDEIDDEALVNLSDLVLSCSGPEEPDAEGSGSESEAGRPTSQAAWTRTGSEHRIRQAKLGFGSLQRDALGESTRQRVLTSWARGLFLPGWKCIIRRVWLLKILVAC